MDKDFIIEQLKRQINQTDVKPELRKIGRVVEVGDGIARVTGLDDIMMSEMVRFSSEEIDAKGDLYGVVLNLEEGQVGVVVIGEVDRVKEGDQVEATGQILSVPVGEEMIGRVVNPVGMAIDGGDEIKSKTFYPLEKKATGVMARKGVS